MYLINIYSLGKPIEGENMCQNIERKLYPKIFFFKESDRRIP